MVAFMDDDLNSVGNKLGKEPAIPAHPVSCHLIEVDLLGNVLWSWSYPSCDSAQKLVCLRKFHGIKRRYSKSTEAYKYFRYRKCWFYTFVSSSLTTYENKSTKLEKLDQVGVIIEALDFNPERYQKVTDILFRTYYKQEDPSIVLQQFLTLIVSGTCQLPKKKIFCSSDYDTSLPFSDFQIRAIISKFGLETIVLLTALLREQRIVIYDHDIDALVKYALSIPALGINGEAEAWSSVYPWVGFNDDELDNFKDSKFHVLGCPHAAVENRNDLYDVFVNIPAGEITVAAHAKEKMMMGKLHKEMALYMVQLIENQEISECDMVQEIRTKVKELSIHIHQQKKDVSTHVA